MMFGEPVTRIRRVPMGVDDDYGHPVTTDVESSIGFAAFDPGGTRENVEVGRAPVVTTPKLYFANARPDLHSGDRVVVRGREWAVEGDPADWRAPWAGGDFGGLVVELKAVTG